MSTRVQVVIDELEREAFRQAAAREGLSLSDWLRRAARDRLRSASQTKLQTAAQLRAFFRDCDARERGEEPDWHEHQAVIEESRAHGRPTS